MDRKETPSDEDFRSAGHFNTSSLVNVTELLQLTNLKGVTVTDITWPRVRMSSDKWVCIRQNKQQLFDLKDVEERQKQQEEDEELAETESRGGSSKKGSVVVTVLHPCTSETQSFESDSVSSAIMNPVRPIIALACDVKMYTMCLNSNKCIAWTKLPFQVQYWTWINETVIGLVGQKAVYHWEAVTKSGPDSGLHFKFSRHERLKNCQITGYKCDESLTWFALSGLYIEKGSRGVNGVTQVYSTFYDYSHCIETHSAQFTRYRFSESESTSSVLVTAKKSSLNSGKVSIVELGPVKSSLNWPLISRTELMVWSDSMSSRYDFPVSVVCSSKLGLIYVISKYGSLYVYDLESGTSLVGKTRICSDVIFEVTLDHETQGLIAVARNGQVLGIELQLEQLVDHLIAVNKKSLAQRLREAMNVSVFGDEVTRL